MIHHNRHFNEASKYSKRGHENCHGDIEKVQDTLLRPVDSRNLCQCFWMWLLLSFFSLHPSSSDPFTEASTLQCHFHKRMTGTPVWKARAINFLFNDQPVRRMIWAPLSVSTTSLSSPTLSSKVALSKASCIWPRLNQPVPFQQSIWVSIRCCLRATRWKEQFGWNVPGPQGTWFIISSTVRWSDSQKNNGRICLVYLAS
jgi:hypothetical protein